VLRALYAASPVVMHRGLEEVKLQRVFSSCWWIIPHLHGKCYFAELVLETVGASLNLSCGTSFKCQGISLP